jgi:cell wall-associated NlpC family hydrolase
VTWDGLLGLPYADQGRAGAVDCWGLVRLAYAAIGIDLPSYAGEYHDLAEREEVAAVMSKGQGAMLPVSDPRAYDVVVFRRAGLDAHVGLVVEPGLMLHIDQTAPSRIEPYTGPRWSPRLSGFYRHRLLA